MNTTIRINIKINQWGRHTKPTFDCVRTPLKYFDKGFVIIWGGAGKLFALK
jgi:hypothetical protein